VRFFAAQQDSASVVLARNLRKLQRLRVSDVGISAITLSELDYGVRKSAKPVQNEIALAGFLAPLEVFPYDDLAAQEYGRLRAGLEEQGTPIGSMDMLIAAHALALGHILVTNNTAEFRRVSGLVVQNWAT